jgi:hypothetical protein
MRPLRIFIGYDAREPVAYHVLAHSILARTTVPVSFTPLVQPALRASGLYRRERDPLESTAFSLTRFLVPYLAGYQGQCVYLDCDMLCRADIADLPRPYDVAVTVCQHDYTPRRATKFLHQPQTIYPRKNWSSLMVFDAAKCRALTPEYVNTATPAELHRLAWADQIGALPLEWNHLVGEDNQAPGPPKIIHFTNGGVWFGIDDDPDYTKAWLSEWDAMSGAVVTPHGD